MDTAGGRGRGSQNVIEKEVGRTDWEADESMGKVQSGEGVMYSHSVMNSLDSADETMRQRKKQLRTGRSVKRRKEGHRNMAQMMCESKAWEQRRVVPRMRRRRREDKRKGEDKQRNKQGGRKERNARLTRLRVALGLDANQPCVWACRARESDAPPQGTPSLQSGLLSRVCICIRDTASVKQTRMV